MSKIFDLETVKKFSIVAYTLKYKNLLFIRINLAATYSKRSMYIIHKKCFS